MIEPKVTSSNCCCCSTKQSEAQRLFINYDDKEKQQILTFNKPEPSKCWKMTSCCSFIPSLIYPLFCFPQPSLWQQMKRLIQKGKVEETDKNVVLDSISCWGLKHFVRVSEERSRRRGDRRAWGEAKVEIRRASAEGEREDGGKTAAKGTQKKRSPH